MKKLNLDKLNSLINETGQLIQDDVVMSSGEQIAEISEAFDSIKDEIWGEKKWWFSVIASWVKKDEDFQYKSFESKISSIFDRFDSVTESVANSITIFSKYGKSLEQEIVKINTYVDSIDKETLEQDDILEYKTICVIRDNLQLSMARIAMRLESAKRLYKQMELSRPAFQTLLSSVLMESAGQRAIEASVGIMKVLGGAIDQMSEKLTTQTIESAKMALEAEVRPMLGAGDIRRNVERIQSELLVIANTREQYMLEASNQK